MKKKVMKKRDNEKTKMSPRGGFGGRTQKRKEKKDDVLSGRLKKKTCRFCEEKVQSLDYKDLKRYERLVSDRGKMLSRRITGVCAKHQRMVVDVVKKARFLALLPFLKR
ncbi:MAG: 30S ribosomal protein S18 [Candidatus Omnitrophota bacterium]